MAEDDRTEKEKLNYQIGKYLFDKQDARFKKMPSRLEKAHILLYGMGLSLETVANESPEVAGALRTLLEEKKKWFQFLNKDVRDKLYNKIYDGIADAIEKKSRESNEVISLLEKRLESKGQLFQKNPKPIDQLKIFNTALGKTQKSLFKDYFKPSSNSKESLFQSVSNAFYRSKIIRIILGFGTDRDVSIIQEQVKKINAQSYGNTVQAIQANQRKEMDTLRVPALKMTERPKVEFATIHKPVEEKPTVKEGKVKSPKAKVASGTPLRGIARDTRDTQDPHHRMIFSASTKYKPDDKPDTSSTAKKPRP